MCSVHSDQVEGNKYSHETKSPAHDQAELVEGDAAIPEVNLRDCQSPRQPNSMTPTRVAINKAQRGGLPTGFIFRGRIAHWPAHSCR